METAEHATTAPTGRRRPRRMALLGTAAAVALVGGAYVAGTAAGTPPSATVTRTVWGTTAPANAPGQSLIISQVTIPPGASLAPHFHQGTQVARITAGTLTYHILSGTAVVTTAAGVTTQPTGPAVVTLHEGDVLVENAGLAHWAANLGKQPVVIALSSLLRSGAAPSTPLGGGAAPTLHVDATLTSSGTDLHSVNSNVQYGWNHLVGPGTGTGGQSVGTDMQGNVSYTSGSGGFGGFVTFTFTDGSTLGTRMEGTATAGVDSTTFQATMVVLGGTGRYQGATGSGTFTGSRTGAIGTPVISMFDLYLG